MGAVPRALAAALLLLTAGAARAAEWEVRDDASVLEFDVVVNDIENRGRFPAFTGRGSFDPEAPERSALSLEIDASRLDLGNPIASTFARSVDWFDAEAHPTALFRLDGVRPDPDGVEGEWLATGVLELRGIAQPVEAALVLVLEDGEARAIGETVVDRTLFGIGRGPTSLIIDVEREIRVRFDLSARPVLPQAADAD
ncbi:MAG: YceI family protein [Pseudomonadota bacterium]